MMALTETPVGVEKKLAEVLARIWDNHEYIRHPIISANR